MLFSAQQETWIHSQSEGNCLGYIENYTLYVKTFIKCMLSLCCKWVQYLIRPDKTPLLFVLIKFYCNVMFIITMGAFISIVICYKQWNSQSVLFQIPTQCLVCKWLVSYYVAFAYYFGLQAMKIFMLRKYNLKQCFKVDEVMQSLRQAFNSAWQAAGPTSVCDMCPLHQLHQLCVQLEGELVCPSWLLGIASFDHTRKRIARSGLLNFVILRQCQLWSCKKQQKMINSFAKKLNNKMK